MKVAATDFNRDKTSLPQMKEVSVYLFISVSYHCCLWYFL